MKFCKAVCWNSQGFWLFCLFKGGVIRRKFRLGTFIAVMEWSDSEKYLTELKKTILLKNACLDLREEFDEYQSERLNLICKSYLPKNRNNSRDIPSRKVGRNSYINLYLGKKDTLCLFYRPAIKLML